MNVPAIPPFFHRTYAGAQGVASNQTAIVSVPASGRHYESRLEFKTSAGAYLTKAQIISEVTEIRVKLNGQDIIQATPTFLFDLQEYYGSHKGSTVVDGVLLIDWARRHLNLPLESKQYALGMENVQTFTIEIQCGTLANLDKIDFVGTVTNERSPLGPHVRILKLSREFSGTGEVVDSNLPVVADQGLIAAHISDGVGTISYATLNVGDVMVLDRLSTKSMESILKHNERTPQTGYYHIDFGVRNEALGFLPMAPNDVLIKDFRLTTNWTVAPTNYDIYLERVYGLAG